MAATGFTPVYLYASGTAGHIPLAANLTNTTNGSEIALNYADGNLFFKNSSNSVITTPLLQASGSQNGWLSSTDWTTFNGKQAALISGTNIKTVSGISLLGSGDLGTIGTGYGGTGLTSFTSGGVLYASSTSALTTGTALYFDGTNLGVGSTTSYGKITTGTNNATNMSVAFASNNAGGGNGTGDSMILKVGGTTVASYDWQLVSGSFLSSLYAYNNLAIKTGTTPAEIARFWQSGGVSIGNTTDPGAGNLRFNTTGSNGIYFGSSSQLNDYETGSWTPSISSGFTSPSINNINAVYTKIGRLVTASCVFNIASGTPAATSFEVSGLPYTSGSGYGGGSVLYSAITNTGFPTVTVSPSSSKVDFYNLAGSNVLGTTLTAAFGYFGFTVTYST